MILFLPGCICSLILWLFLSRALHPLGVLTGDCDHLQNQGLQSALLASIDSSLFVLGGGGHEPINCHYEKERGQDTPLFDAGIDWEEFTYLVVFTDYG